MRARMIRTGLAGIASTATLIVVMAAGAPAAGAATSGGQSNVCSTLGAPTTTQTFSVEPVAHATVFTCGDATATGFQECPKQTVAVPDAVHATLYYCVPLSFNVALGPQEQTVSVDGVGGVTVGTG